MHRFTIRGTRGTLPASGKQFLRYGGDTTCYTVETDEGILIIDAGTGLAQLGTTLASHTETPPITMMFTHFHMDHIIGLPCFTPLYNKSASIDIIGDPRRESDWGETLRTFMEKPYWPVALVDTDAVMRMIDLPLAEKSITTYGIEVTWFSVPHPQQCVAFRLEMPCASVVVATDTEYTPDKISSGFLDFCRGADFLIHDSQYTPAEYPRFKGWGHSTWETAAHVAKRSGVGKLILTHHAPERTDEEIDSIIQEARAVFSSTDAASSGMILAE